LTIHGFRMFCHSNQSWNPADHTQVDEAVNSTV
jgi:hypothetical protein